MSLENLLQKCKKIEYRGLQGENSDNPSFIFNGKWFVFEKDKPMLDCIISICQENNIELESVVNPYYMLSKDQAIAEMVADKLEHTGYTQALISGIVLNYTNAKLALLSGITTNEEIEKKIVEGEYLENLRQQFIVEAYSEYYNNFKYLGYGYGYEYNPNLGYGHIYEIALDYYQVVGEN